MKIYELVLKEPGFLIWATFHMGDRMPTLNQVHNWLDAVLVTSVGGYMMPGGSVSCARAPYVLRNWSAVRTSPGYMLTLRSMGAEEFYFSYYKGALYEWTAMAFKKEVRNTSLVGREEYPDPLIKRLASSIAMAYWPSPGPFHIRSIGRTPSCNDIRCPAVIKGESYVDIRAKAV